MYSQNNEELFILEHFADKPGRFLDIGAFDGKTFSNTLALVERGWSGVCIEPSPSVFVSLLKQHGENPRIKLLNAAVTVMGGFFTFYDSGGDAISSTLEAHAKKWAAGYGTKFASYDVFTVALDELFNQYGFDFDFINLDIEGCSFAMFQHLPIARLAKTTCLCVEHDGNINAAIQKGSEWGFRMLTSNGENIILVR